MPWQGFILVTSHRHQYDVIVVTVAYLWRHWYSSMVDSVCHAPPNLVYAMLHQIFNATTNWNSFNSNFRFSHTNFSSHLIQCLYLNILSPEKTAVQNNVYKILPLKNGYWVRYPVLKFYYMSLAIYKGVSRKNSRYFSSGTVYLPPCKTKIALFLSYVHIFFLYFAGTNWRPARTVL